MKKSKNTHTSVAQERKSLSDLQKLLSAIQFKQIVSPKKIKSFFATCDTGTQSVLISLFYVLTAILHHLRISFV